MPPSGAFLPRLAPGPGRGFFLASLAWFAADGGEDIEKRFAASIGHANASAERASESSRMPFGGAEIGKIDAMTIMQGSVDVKIMSRH